MLFQVRSPIGFHVRTTKGYWKIITAVKHPSMAKRVDEVKKCILEPDEVRLSKRDKSVYLFYRGFNSGSICVVVKYEGKRSYIITSYLTDKIKEGEVIWRK